MRILAALFFVAWNITPAVAADMADLPPSPAAHDSAAFGVWLGASALGGLNGYHVGGREIGLLFDTALPRGTRVRVDAGRSTHVFEERDWDTTLRRDAVTMKNVCMSLLRARRLGRRTRAYAGGGVGAYRYTYEATRREATWRGGVHAIAGLQVANPARRYAVIGEIRMHAANGPQQSPLTSVLLVKTAAALGMRVRF